MLRCEVRFEELQSLLGLVGALDSEGNALRGLELELKLGFGLELEVVNASVWG